MIYDVIGDVHGQADKLVGLLSKLGYRHDGRSYIAPPNHQAIFIGDLIDRGNQQLATLKIAFDMLDNKQAQIIMGNHEYNALAYATKDKSNTNAYLRPHTPNNTKQHQAFLDEVVFGSKTHHYWLERFLQLPLWLETDEAIFIHACYDLLALKKLKPLLSPQNTLSLNTLQTAKKTTSEFEAIEHILKGIEILLPDLVHFYDKSGFRRTHARVKWWIDHWQQKNIQTVLFADNLPDLPLPKLPPNLINFQSNTKKPIFIGHYWMSGAPDILSEKVVCVDYSAGTDGYLTAYRFDSNNPQLSRHHFIQFFG